MNGLLRNQIGPVVALLACAILASCASGENIPPPGGPPDKQPPSVATTTPPDGTVNFAESRIEIEFDENISPKGISDEVFVTPIPPREPKITASGTSISIEFEEPLANDRTYTVTVGPGVTDRAGNRIGKATTIRFSTGDVLDSGSIAGTILEADERSGTLFAWIVPSANPDEFLDTLSPSETYPDFIVPVADNGSFSLQGLPNATFLLAAVVDDFGNRTIERDRDAFGTASELVHVNDSLLNVRGVSIRLPVAPFDLSGPLLQRATSLGEQLTQLTFSEPLDTSSFTPGQIELATDGSAVTATGITAAFDRPSRFFVVHPRLNADTEYRATIAATARDTAGQVINDTARSVTFTATNRPDTVAPELIAPTIPESGWILSRPLSFGFGEPVELIVGETSTERRIAWLADTASGEEIGIVVRRRSSVHWELLPVDSTYSGRNVLLTIDLRQFVDRAGNRGDSAATIRVNAIPAPQLGTISGILVDSASPANAYVLELRSQATPDLYRIELDGPGEWEFANVPSGRYSLSAYRDTDEDGAFDFGSFTPWMPGEVLTTYSGGVEVRPRWTTSDLILRF